ncbi:MAG: sulfide/dihydroorotate dehydrogenase-like FAD/NAD-binding protein [Prolixibacteraceae bacterium]|nr:sulfide/dihydroorotate dehydrogenase-like FAD/NAD-binding protein [Prolixibacteraceae bacterium]
MNWIISKKNLSESIAKLEIRATEIARVCKPGHHVIVKIFPDSENLPMVISGVDRHKETIILYVHKIGALPRLLAGLNVGDEIFSVEGPCGEAVPIIKAGTVVLAAGGIGISPLLPIAEAMKKAGNRVITILGARSGEYLILEKQIGQVSDELIIMTDDGSAGRKGLVVEGILDVLRREKINQVITIGPARMIKNSTLITRRFNIPQISILYSSQVGTDGLNGIYRVSICDCSKYICVDGMDFNAYYPDFDTMIEKMKGRLVDDYSGNQVYQEAMIYI